LNDPNLRGQLQVAIEEAWKSADLVRAPLLNSAARQIEHGRSAYQSLKNILGRKEQGNSFLHSAAAEHVV
jgi:hypothetical protein